LRPHLAMGLPLTLSNCAPTMQKWRFTDKHRPRKTSDKIALMSNPMKSLADCLGGKIAALEQRAQAAITLTERVRRALPEPERNHVLAASYNGADLIVLTESSAWCTRLRYAEAELRAAMIATGEQPFTRIRFRVGLPDSTG
jgi:hypothetical protein